MGERFAAFVTSAGLVFGAMGSLSGGKISSAHADEAPPDPKPSLTLQRGIALQKRGDHLPATIELHKVLSRQTNDTVDRRLQAQMHLARALDGAGFKVAALSHLTRLIANGPHSQTDNAVRGIVVLGRELPGAAAHIALARGKINVASASLSDIRDEARAGMVRGLVKLKDLLAADRVLQLISQKSPHYQHALFALGMGTAMKKGWKEAGLFFDKITEPTMKARIKLVTARLTAGSDREYEQAAKLYTEAAATKSKWAALANAERSLLAVRRAQKLPLLRAVPELFVAAVYYDYCHKGPLQDALAGVRGEAPAIRKRVEPLTRITRQSKLFTVLRKTLDEGGLSERALELVREALAAPETRAAFAWADALGRELGTLAKTSTAWKNTAVAAEVLQGLMLARSLAQSEGGKHAKVALMRLLLSLDGIVAWSARVPTVTDPAKAGVLVSPTACPKGTPMYKAPQASSASSSTTTNNTSTATPTPVAKKGGGCVGCTSGGAPSGWLLSGLIGLLLFRRRGLSQR